MTPRFSYLAEEALSRCRVIAGFSENRDSISRTFLSAPMRSCHAAFGNWMKELGMSVSVDAVGNLRGLLAEGRQAPRFLMGSHLDTVPCAGAYDGVLGVCIALAVVEALEGKALPFEIEVFGFSEEEGVRFRMPFLGSLAVIGRFDQKLFELQDSGGCKVSEAILQFGLDPTQVPDARVNERAFGYLEFHIEQGPVLDMAGESIAAVSAIAGQSRLEAVFSGRANHAGTTPMELRQDALAGAAEWITRVEQVAKSMDGLVATVGSLQVAPGAVNAIPGEVRASLDVRHASDGTRNSAVCRMCGEAEQIAMRRQLKFRFEERLSQSAVGMNEGLVARIEQAMRDIGEVPRRMVSGAGHDAMILAERMPSAMVFVRSVGGVSHHPDESVRWEDVEKAIRVGVAMLTDLAKDCQRTK